MSGKLRKPKLKKPLETNALYEPTTQASGAEIEMRVAEVEAWILAGYTRRHILKLAEKWQLTPRAVDNYIARAKEEIKEVNLVTLHENLAIVTNNYWRLYRETKESNRLLAVSILEKIAKLRGLEQTTLVVEDRRLEHLDDEDLEHLLKQKG